MLQLRRGRLFRFMELLDLPAPRADSLAQLGRPDLLALHLRDRQDRGLLDLRDRVATSLDRLGRLARLDPRVSLPPALRGLSAR